jgi:hypothetical protein
MMAAKFCRVKHAAGLGQQLECCLAKASQTGTVKFV